MNFCKGMKQNTYLWPMYVFVIDVIASVVASFGMFLVLDVLLPQLTLGRPIIITWFCGSLVASVISFFIFRLYRVIIRYSTLREIGRLFVAVMVKETLLLLTLLVIPGNINMKFAFVMVLIDFLLSVFFLEIIRVAMVYVYDLILTRLHNQKEVKRVLIYGIGDKAVAACSRLHNSSNYRVVGFITYESGKAYRLVGKPVYCFTTANDVKKIAQDVMLDGVLYPYEADVRTEQNRLVDYCMNTNLKAFIAPNIDEITDGKNYARAVRNIKIEDLLGRPEIEISMDEIMANFKGKVVMVTGAAGSIGSQLCRQLVQLGVHKLILFDNAETPLHNMRLELEDQHPELDFVPVIGDVRSSNRLDFVFRKYRPQVVFHAAAYKHVPLMEENPCEAVRVNVMGSRLVADFCVEYGVEKMVMISTDKAVNPTNIMGCTKRLAEIYVQSLGLAIERGEVKGSTVFVTTRFGNVLGSNGSVIPRFREQIESGGPITVTHPDINRFFMTIPEACRLVMEAATLAKATRIFIFDMGEPVKIVTLAERMIKLAGLQVGKDIKITFCGLRPGEKLYEEVLATKENTEPTPHKRIFVAKVREYDHDAATRAVDELNRLAEAVEIPDMVQLMKKTVPEFISEHSEFERFDKHKK